MWSWHNDHHACFYLELQEWPEEVYPPYANGPGYVLSSDIAKNVVSDFEKHKLRVQFINLISMSFSPLLGSQLFLSCIFLLDLHMLVFWIIFFEYLEWGGVRELYNFTDSLMITKSRMVKPYSSNFITYILQLFKMEDVSMGMWVEQFNNSKPVKYVHSLKFCQFGCIEDYYTAHYQSPRQMICLWRKLQKQGRPHCCNMRWQPLFSDIAAVLLGTYGKSSPRLENESRVFAAAK